jgi:hypothetical protein
VLKTQIDVTRPKCVNSTTVAGTPSLHVEPPRDIHAKRPGNKPGLETHVWQNYTSTFSSSSTDNTGHLSYKNYKQDNIVHVNKLYLLLE